ncbi:MAG: tRNA-dihydrouridine synthase, partial [Gammaproteobacteria bacterium]
IMLAHLDELCSFYGEYTGVRVARKHLTWYLRNRPDSGSFRNRLVRVEVAEEQQQLVRQYFDQTPQEELAA